MFPKRSFMLLPLALAGALVSMPADAQKAPVVSGANLQQWQQDTASSQLSALFQAWTSAVVLFSHQVGSLVPWNVMNTTTPVAYAPLRMYAGSNPAACGFPSASGVALPTVNIGASLDLSRPVNLGGLSVNLAPAGVTNVSQQAMAYQQAIGAPNTFFPGAATIPYNGTLCASALYNQPNPMQIQIAAWFVPGQAVSDVVTYTAAQKMANVWSQSMGTNHPYSMIYGGSTGDSWKTLAVGGSQGFWPALKGWLGFKGQ